MYGIHFYCCKVTIMLFSYWKWESYTLESWNKSTIVFTFLHYNFLFIFLLNLGVMINFFSGVFFQKISETNKSSSMYVYSRLSMYLVDVLVPYLLSQIQPAIVSFRKSRSFLRIS